MSLFDDVKNLLASSTLGASPAGDASTHFEQLAQSIDSGTLAQGIAASMRSDETPPFAHLVSQLFASASGDQKSTIVKTLLSSLTQDQRAHLEMLVPGMGTDAAALTPEAVQTLARGVEQHDAGIVEKMSAVYAAHPTLIKTLGAAALTIAMRHIAQQQNQQA
jgi:hypothetical protein